MLRTMTVLSLGFLLAGASAAGAGDPNRTFVHKLHAHSAIHETFDPRAWALAPAPMWAPARRPETDGLTRGSDPPGAEWNFRGGDAGYSWEPNGWAK
jgi:hypothetical protein